MATRQDEGAVPDFLQMDGPGGPQSTNPHSLGQWYGWPSSKVNPVNLLDDEGRVQRVRTPVMDLEGPHYPYGTALRGAATSPSREVVSTDKWSLKVEGEVKNPLTIDYDSLRQFQAAQSARSWNARAATHLLRSILRVRGPGLPAIRNG